MNRNRFLIAMLLVFTVIVSSSVFASTSRRIHPDLVNGIYLVHAEFRNSEKANRLPSGYILCEYTSDHLVSRVSAQTDPARYIVIKDAPSVPVVLADKPELSTTNDKYEFSLQFKLAPEYIDQMEKFTGDNLNKRIALVVGGKIITIHKIRSAIKNGLITITRCTDNGCKVIYQNLVETN